MAAGKGRNRAPATSGVTGRPPRSATQGWAKCRTDRRQRRVPAEEDSTEEGNTTGRPPRSATQRVSPTINRLVGYRSCLLRLLRERHWGPPVLCAPYKLCCNRPKFQDRDFLKRFCFTFRYNGLVFAGVGMIPPKTERARDSEGHRERVRTSVGSSDEPESHGHRLGA